MEIFYLWRIYYSISWNTSGKIYQ